MNAPRLPLTAWVLQMPDNKPLAVGFNVPFKEAIAATKARGVVLPEKYYGELQGIHRALNYSIAGVASLDQLQAVLNSHEDALKNGTTFKEWQNDVRVQDLGLSKARLDNIYRTNIQSAYNRGRWEQYVENKANRPYLMYDAINDSRVRPSHLAMDGIIRPVGDSFWDTNYPPNGFRCRCRCISLNAKQAAERSKNGTGLNQKVTPDMKPDKGWDYNVGEDLTAGIERAVEQRLADERIARQLKSALKSQIADTAKVVESQIVKDTIEKTTMTDWKELSLPSAKELLKSLELIQAPEVINIANNEQEALEILRAELGVKIGEKRTIITPVGNVLVDDEWLPHIVEKRDAARERFSKWIIPTLKEPTEVWLSDYGNNEFRKRYLKLFSASDKQMLVVISILNDSVIWNVVPMPVRSMDNQRNGELLLKNH